jgi:hypothetical protein
VGASAAWKKTWVLKGGGGGGDRQRERERDRKRHSEREIKTIVKAYGGPTKGTTPQQRFRMVPTFLCSESHIRCRIALPRQRGSGCSHLIILTSLFPIVIVSKEGTPPHYEQVISPHGCVRASPIQDNLCKKRGMSVALRNVCHAVPHQIYSSDVHILTS